MTDGMFRYSSHSYENESRGYPQTRISVGGTPEHGPTRYSTAAELASQSGVRSSMGSTAGNRGMTPQQGGYGGWGFLNYVQEPTQPKTWGVVASGPEWDNDLVLSDTHYHHGDHHHNHHQRHIHHFHELHLLGSAEEVLDLTVNPAVRTKIIPGSGTGPQMTLRPDVLGRQAFEAGCDQYFSSLSARFDSLSRGAPSSPPPAVLPNNDTSVPFMTSGTANTTRRTSPAPQ